MKKLENYTMKQITDYIIDDIAATKDINKTLARKLFINALSYNLVIEQIENQIDFLLEDE